MYVYIYVDMAAEAFPAAAWIYGGTRINDTFTKRNSSCWSNICNCTAADKDLLINSSELVIILNYYWPQHNNVFISYSIKWMENWIVLRLISTRGKSFICIQVNKIIYNSFFFSSCSCVRTIWVFLNSFPYIYYAEAFAFSHEMHYWHMSHLLSPSNVISHSVIKAQSGVNNKLLVIIDLSIEDWL